MGKAEATRYIIISVIFAAVVFSFLVGVIIFVLKFRKRKLEYDQERKTLLETHKTELAHLQIEIQQQTMQDIGREIHDHIGQQLTLASIYSQQMQHEADTGDNNRLEQVVKLINSSLTGLRSLSKTLTDSAAEQTSLQELLQRECEKVNGLGLCSATAVANTGNIFIGYHTKIILLRLVQECIQNALKHAGCRNIHISLEASGQGIQLGVQDDGHGFDTYSKINTGIGLQNMRKRAAMLDADFSLTSKSGAGTLVLVRVPANKLNL